MADGQVMFRLTIVLIGIQSQEISNIDIVVGNNSENEIESQGSDI